MQESSLYIKKVKSVLKDAFSKISNWLIVLNACLLVPLQTSRPSQPEIEMDVLQSMEGFAGDSLPTETNKQKCEGQGKCRADRRSHLQLKINKGLPLQTNLAESKSVFSFRAHSFLFHFSFEWKLIRLQGSKTHSLQKRFSRSHSVLKIPKPHYRSISTLMLFCGPGFDPWPYLCVWRSECKVKLLRQNCKATNSSRFLTVFN